MNTDFNSLTAQIGARAEWETTDLQSEQPGDAWEVLMREWPSRKDSIREAWNQLTPEDVDSIHGSRSALIELLQTRYDWSPEESEGEVDRWITSDAARTL